MGNMSVAISFSQSISVCILIKFSLYIPLFNLSVLTNLNGAFQIRLLFSPVIENRLIFSGQLAAVIASSNSCQIKDCSYVFLPFSAPAPVNKPGMIHTFPLHP